MKDETHTSKEEEIKKEWKQHYYAQDPRKILTQKEIADYWLKIRQQSLTEQKEKFREMIKKKINTDPYGHTTIEGRAGYVTACRDLLSELINL